MAGTGKAHLRDPERALKYSSPFESPSKRLPTARWAAPTVGSVSRNNSKGPAPPSVMFSATSGLTSAARSRSTNAQPPGISRTSQVNSRAAGFGSTRTDTEVTMPSVPNEPHQARMRS